MIAGNNTGFGPPAARRPSGPSDIVEADQRGHQLQGLSCRRDLARIVVVAPASNDVSLIDVRGPVAGRLDDDRVDRVGPNLLQAEPISQLERRLQAFVLEVAAIDERAGILVRCGAQQFAARLKIRKTRRVVDCC